MKIRLLLSTTPPMLRILFEEKNENKDSSAMPPLSSQIQSQIKKTQ
jgi:predicted SPOUT superfamily RNA methylase MTH1